MRAPVIDDSRAVRRIGSAPAVRDRGDVCRVDALRRGRPLVLSVQGALPPLPVPHPQHDNPHLNGASL